MEELWDEGEEIVPLHQTEIERLINALRLLKAVYVAMGHGFISEELAQAVDFYFEEDEETH